METAKLPDFTPRELDVVRLVARLFTRQQIAKALKLSYNTITSHMYSIFKKVGVHCQAELIAFAQDNGYGKEIVVW